MLYSIKRKILDLALKIEMHPLKEVLRHNITLSKSFFKIYGEVFDQEMSKFHQVKAKMDQEHENKKLYLLHQVKILEQELTRVRIYNSYKMYCSVMRAIETINISASEDHFKSFTNETICTKAFKYDVLITKELASHICQKL